MSESQSEQPGAQIAQLQPRHIGAVALFYPVFETLNLASTIHALVPSAADVDLRRIVVLLVLNRLLLPQPLYEVDEWFSGTVLPAVLGILEDKGYDNRLGRALERLYPYWGEIWARTVSTAM